MVNIKMLAKVCGIEGKKEGAFDAKNLKKNQQNGHDWEEKAIEIGRRKRNDDGANRVIFERECQKRKKTV